MLGDRRLVVRAALELALANGRYLVSVAPVVRRALEHWERRAQAIPDRQLRALALSKLRSEGFNAEAGAMLATLAPRARRKHVVKAIVALELLFDLLDGLTELSLPEPLRDGERLFAVFTDALAPYPNGGVAGGSGDGGYMCELSVAAGEAFARLPAAATVSHAAHASAVRAAQAQVHMHAVPRLGVDQLEMWARARAHETELGWRELLCGSASSVLAVHALIAVAADPSTTVERATRIDDAYLSICELLTLLDGLVDRDEDAHSDRLGYLGLYQDQALLTRVLADAVARADGKTRELPDAAHHLMILNGVVAYYASAPGARSAFARPIIAELSRALAPLIWPTLAGMRAWRLARRAGGWRSPIHGSEAPVGLS